jgi:hypothetical protein
MPGTTYATPRSVAAVIQRRTINRIIYLI